MLSFKEKVDHQLQCYYLLLPLFDFIFTDTFYKLPLLYMSLFKRSFFNNLGRCGSTGGASEVCCSPGLGSSHHYYNASEETMS